jgi:hypothetical protein
MQRAEVGSKGGETKYMKSKGNDSQDELMEGRQMGSPGAWYEYRHQNLRCVDCHHTGRSKMDGGVCGGSR